MADPDNQVFTPEDIIRAVVQARRECADAQFDASNPECDEGDSGEDLLDVIPPDVEDEDADQIDLAKVLFQFSQ